MAFHAHCAPRDQGLVQCRCSLRSRSGQPLYHPHSRRIWIRRGAATVAHVAPPNSSVLLLVHRSANFIFNLATYQERPDLRVVRAEKLFTHYRGNREFVIRDYGFDWPRIPNCWIRITLVRWLSNADFGTTYRRSGAYSRRSARSHSNEFVSIPLTVKYRDEQPAVLDIYVRQDYTPRPYSDITIDVPLIGLHVTVPARTSDR